MRKMVPSSSGMGKGNKCKNALVKNHIFPNSPQINPLLLQPGFINTQPASKCQASLDQRVSQISQEVNQIILSPNQSINQNLDIQIDQNQINNQQVPNEINTQENNGNVQNPNDLHQVVQLNQMQIMNQMNYSQNGQEQDQFNDRERSKEISIVDTEALNGLTEKINKLADNVGLLVQEQKESNQNQAKLLDLLTKKFLLEENKKVPPIDNDQSKKK